MQLTTLICGLVILILCGLEFFMSRTAEGEVMRMKKLMAVLLAICEGVILAVEIFKNDISKGN